MNNHSIIATIKTEWDIARSSLWLVPSIMVVSVMILAAFLLFIDRQYQSYLSTNLPWLFSGSPSAARSVLSTIAGSAITVISIAFSLTIVALQQASVQFTPRVLRTFTSDKGNQIVLGTYIATFLYALLILRAVRSAEESSSSFVPSVATSFAVLLAIVCTGLLIYFINHIGVSLQASTIISRVHRELLRQIDQLFPDRIGDRAAAKPNAAKAKKSTSSVSTKTVRSPTDGFVVRIEEDAFQNLNPNSAVHIRILPQIGDFVFQGQTIATIEQTKATDHQAAADAVSGAVIIETQRSMTQDPMFAIRQLVDIAIKALSPGINDQTTATYCINYLGDALARLADRQLPGPHRSFSDGRVRVFFNRPDWEEFVSGAFGQIQFEARDKPQVTMTLLQVLRELSERVSDDARKPPLRQLLRNSLEIVQTGPMLDLDKDQIRAMAKDIEHSLNSRP